MLVLLLSSAGRAATSSVTTSADVFVSENKIITLDHPVGEITSPTPEIVKGEKVPGSDNQFVLEGIKSGDGSVTVHSGDEVLNYNVNVSPMPERIYINIPESKRIALKDSVEDVTTSTQGIIRVVQPSDKILLLEALRQGKTTVTVTSKGEIYRYFISTFDNRGADLLDIENAFAARGYHLLTVSFEKDQATISGTVPTQEELDDAVRIVKQYTPYVIVKAVVGATGVEAADSEDERIVINNIERIAQVKGLIVRVQFPHSVETDNSTFTRVAGTPALTNTTVDNQTRLSTTNTVLPTADPNAGLSKPAQEGTIENVTITKTIAVPEKIFLFGDVESDLDEARAVRVARTFSPEVISFLTVKDPIQIRLRTRLLEIDLSKTKDVGVLWSDSVSTTNPPNVTLGFHSPNFTPGTVAPGVNSGMGFNTVQGLVNNSINNIMYGLAIDANAQIRLLETRNIGRTVYDQSQFLTNGQPGEFFSGQQIPYVSAVNNTSNGSLQYTTSFVSVGFGVTILPLNYAKAGGTGTPGSPTTRITSTMPKYMPGTGIIGNVDETLKYVDEDGNIGMDITTSLSALIQFLNVGNNVQAPETSSRQTVNRAVVKDKQSVIASGLFNDAVTRAIKSVPFFNKIPVFGFLFENPVDTKNTTEILVIYTPEVVRMKDSDVKRMPKPQLPEMQDTVMREGLIPLVKPVRYDGVTTPASIPVAMNTTTKRIIQEPLPVSNELTVRRATAVSPTVPTTKTMKIAATETPTPAASRTTRQDNVAAAEVSLAPGLPSNETAAPTVSTTTTTTTISVAPVSSTVPPVTAPATPAPTVPNGTLSVSMENPTEGRAEASGPSLNGRLKMPVIDEAPESPALPSAAPEIEVAEPPATMGSVPPNVNNP